MIHLRTLGALDLRGPDGHEVRSVLAQPKRLALLLYLTIAEPRRFHRREKLLALFWPDLDTPHARNSLSQALSTLRRGLGSEVLVTRGDEEIGLAPGVLDCDVFAFESAIAQGQPADALEQYRGDFLDGFALPDAAPDFDRWMEDQRSRLRTMALAATLDLAGTAEREGDIHLARDWARRATALARWDEGALASWMRLLVRSGDRAGALAAYQEFAERLARELQLEPSRELRALAEEIRAGGVGRTGEPIPPASLETEDIAVPPAFAAVLTGDEQQAVPGSGGRSRAWRFIPVSWQRGISMTRKRAALVVLFATAAGATMAASLALLERSAPGDGAGVDGSIAVLPFESLCDDPESRALVAGLHAELVTQLSRFRRLQVSSRASVQQYVGIRPSVREIAGDLGVATLLEGTVQCAGERIRVNVQLVDAASDRNRWAERYDLERGDLFYIQTDIARSVANALRAELTPDERAALSRPPTANDRAYEAYLQAQEYHLRPGLTEEDARAAESLYRRALALDPTFALAHARLASLHGYIYRIGWDRTPRRHEAWREASATALRLQPRLPEAHLARAFYWAGQERFDNALVELNMAGVENDPDALSLMAHVQCRLARWEECLSGYRRTMEVDPRNAAHPQHLGFALWFMHRHADAVRAFDRALELAPDNHVVALYRGRVFADWLNTTDSLAATLRRLPPEWDPQGVATAHRAMLAWLERRPRDLLVALDSSRQDGLSQWSYEVPFALLRAQAHAEDGNGSAARQYYLEAIPILEGLATERPEVGMRQAMLAWAYAGAGRNADARRAISLAMELQPLERDAMEGAAVLEFAAQVLVQVGDRDEAIEVLERLLAIPSPISVTRLRREARWDPLRRDPRFVRLLDTPPVTSPRFRPRPHVDLHRAPGSAARIGSSPDPSLTTRLPL